jgi:hypothetical protein
MVRTVIGYLVLVIDSSGKRRSYIRAGQSRHEVWGIGTGKETFLTINPLAYTADCQAVWAIDVFAFSSSFLSVDGITCHIAF